MQSDTSYDVSREGWRYTSPYKKFKKVLCRSNEDDDQGTPCVVCGLFLIFCVEDGICRSKTGSGFKKIWCRTPIENLKNSPSPEELCSLCLERIMKRFQKKEGKKNLDTESRTRRSHSRAFYHWDPSPKFEFPTILEITNFKLNRKFKFHTYPPLILVVSGSFI